MTELANRGCERFMDKPIDEEELVNSVAAILERTDK
jgi:DNA-binding response OmpR family regulator